MAKTLEEKLMDRVEFLENGIKEALNDYWERMGRYYTYEEGCDYGQYLADEIAGLLDGNDCAL